MSKDFYLPLLFGTGIPQPPSDLKFVKCTPALNTLSKYMPLASLVPQNMMTVNPPIPTISECFAYGLFGANSSPAYPIADVTLNSLDHVFLVQAKNNAVRKRKRPVVPWLRRTGYIGGEAKTVDKQPTPVEEEESVDITRKGQLDAINATFNAKAMTVRSDGMEAEQVWEILPFDGNSVLQSIVFHKEQLHSEPVAESVLVEESGTWKLFMPEEEEYRKQNEFVEHSTADGDLCFVLHDGVKVIQLTNHTHLKRKRKT